MGVGLSRPERVIPGKRKEPGRRLPFAVRNPWVECERVSSTDGATIW